MLERIEKLLDQYCFGSGTRSRRPEEEVAKLIKNGAFILDVRTGLEAKKGTAPGATNIDLLVLKRHLDELPRDRTIVTYCKSGGRAEGPRHPRPQRLRRGQWWRLRVDREDRREQPSDGFIAAGVPASQVVPSGRRPLR